MHKQWWLVVVRLLCQLSSGVVMQKVLHEGHGGAQALQHGVQVAGIARVVQSAHSQQAEAGRWLQLCSEAAALPLVPQPVTAVTNLPPDRVRGTE